MGVTVDRSLFEQMPKEVAEWMQARTKTDFLEKKNGLITTDVWIDKAMVSATFYVGEEDGTVTARMDFITGMDDLKYEYLMNRTKLNEEQVNALMKEFEAIFVDLKQLVKKAGYRLGVSHPTGDGIGAYWDVVMTEETFNGETFEKIWKKFIEFDEKLNRIYEEHNRYA